MNRTEGAYTYTCRFTKGKARTCRKTKFWSMVFGPSYFGIGPRYLIQSVDPRYWFYMVFDHGIEKILNLYKEKIIRPRMK